MTRTKAIVAIAAVLLVAAAGGFAWRRWNSAPTGFIAASGTIEATEVRVSFKVSGRVVERPVDEGARVAPNQLIARLESLDLEAEAQRLRSALRATQTQVPLLQTEIRLQEELTRNRIAEVQAAVAAREEALKELRAGSRSQELQMAAAEVRQTEVQRNNAEAELRRMRILHARELIAAAALEAAQMAYDVAVERHRSAVERYDLVKEGPRVEEVRRAEAEVRVAKALLLQAQTGELEVVRKRQQLATSEANIARDQAALAVAEAQLGYTILRSPQAGVVLRKHVEPGEIIAAGTPAVTLADLRNIWLRIYIPETALGRVKLGQAAEIRTDTYPGKVYRGTVTYVSSEAEFTPKTIHTPEERVKLVFAVKISVDNLAQELKPGMPADARVLVE
jgi:HlyD family secretion protein